MTKALSAHREEKEKADQANSSLTRVCDELRRKSYLRCSMLFTSSRDTGDLELTSTKESEVSTSSISCHSD